MTVRTFASAPLIPKAQASILFLMQIYAEYLSVKPAKRPLSPARPAQLPQAALLLLPVSGKETTRKAHSALVGTLAL
jgi:hypothetical protein